MLIRHPVLLFVPLAFLLSWYPWILSLIRHSGNGGPNPLGVLLAAIIVTGIVQGRSGLKDFVARIFRVRVGIKWYLFVLLIPLLLCVVAAGLNVLFGAQMTAPNILPSWLDLIERFVFIFLFIGLGEEPGWRGFMLEHLQKTLSPAAASLRVACVWAVWHLPLMGTEFTLPVIPAFLLSLFGATFLMTWMYNRTRGSVFLPMIFHSAVNTIGSGFFFQFFQGRDMTQFWYIYAVLWAVLAAGLIWRRVPTRARVPAYEVPRSA